MPNKLHDSFQVGFMHHIIMLKHHHHHPNEQKKKKVKDAYKSLTIQAQ